MRIISALIVFNCIEIVDYEVFVKERFIKQAGVRTGRRRIVAVSFKQLISFGFFGQFRGRAPVPAVS